MGVKAKDLMIGDWIFAYGHPRQVEIIYNECIQANCIELSKGDFEPISLTAEILEKNGFKVPGYLVWNLEFGAEVQLVPETHDLQNPFMGYRLVVEQKVFGIKDTVICHLKYVHQLQHALKICGIKKEIII